MKFLFIFSLLVVSAYAECSCEADTEEKDRTQSLKLKLIAIASILVGSAIGVTIPILGKFIPILRPERDFFVIIKTFAAGVILATGFIHVFPEAFERLTSPCLNEKPWHEFPFTGFVAMVTAIGTLMVDSLATGYYERQHLAKVKLGNDDVEGDGGNGGPANVHAHAHTTHGHAHGSGLAMNEEDLSSSELLRHRVISQVLELGIVVHSVIIGISVGTSETPSTIKPLMIALTFHQLFEGMGLGGCIAQAKFKIRAVFTMATFFTLTTPIGIAIGFGISNIYDENSPTSLIVQGLFESSAAGILIYMSLVDLLAAEFMSKRMQKNWKLQLWSYLSLLIGAGCMSVLAKWA